MHQLARVRVGGSNPIRIMGIINTSPESFYKKSIFTDKKIIEKTAKLMEEEGANFIDVGGMSTAPYLKTLVSENQEIKRIANAIDAIKKVSKLPISIDTCRAKVAETALQLGAEIVNDVSGLKHDKNMINVLEKYCPSVILCAFSNKLVEGNQVSQARRLIGQSITLALKSGIPRNKIVVDPAIGFFRKNAQGILSTKINSDWLQRDMLVLKNLNHIKQEYPILISVSRKSFIGELLGESDPANRLYGSLAAETFAALNGADLIRTHNVKATSNVVQIVKNLQNFKKGL
ncbi:dihydropteroate synthase [Candidatus Nitrosotalea okcheonensis]|uniref:dihydropteroate synthase n=1 Tax=Candidatus Nitrosotalea okcheonensis TaxID=1903276 RepID=A0A2H1FGK4_9ARCH|nr:dihydropteroate synthase [Candidatus Nitrosotalea okcheonensis]SMH71901.1 Dihydropteroate synthase [Candidatus Nitrosotalea okcheonensis]